MLRISTRSIRQGYVCHSCLSNGRHLLRNDHLAGQFASAPGITLHNRVRYYGTKLENAKTRTAPAKFLITKHAARSGHSRKKHKRRELNKLRRELSNELKQDDFSQSAPESGEGKVEGDGQEQKSVKVKISRESHVVRDFEACDGPKKSSQRNAMISKAPLNDLHLLMHSGKLDEKETMLAKMFMKVRESARKVQKTESLATPQVEQVKQVKQVSKKGVKIKGSESEQHDKEEPQVEQVSKRDAKTKGSEPKRPDEEGPRVEQVKQVSKNGAKKKDAKLLRKDRIKASKATGRKRQAPAELEIRRPPMKKSTPLPESQQKGLDRMLKASTEESYVTVKPYQVPRDAVPAIPASDKAMKRNGTTSEESYVTVKPYQVTRDAVPAIPASDKAMKRNGTTSEEILSVSADDLHLVPLEKEQAPVPALSYGLDRVLFNPGVYSLRDPRSRVYNFDPYLESIMPVTEFDFNALKEYITSSRDEVLISTASEAKKKYTGSTSSMTSALAHFHFLLSQWRPINTVGLSKEFDSEFKTFTTIQRSPTAVFLRWKDGVYAIDADKQFDTANILMMLGKSMEKLMTLPTEDFEKYRKVNSDQISEEERNGPETFHYTTMGDFLMRSQLDAHDPRLPGTGMFDLKTRAVVSIRMDAANYKSGMDYEIRSQTGNFESYEREFYDMIRAAFLKYSLQVRMGRMDGIFVAFHNTQRIFGFQYINLSELDFTIHGTKDTTLGDAEFKLSVDLLNKILDRATAKFPEQSLRLHFETRGSDLKSTPFTYVFAEPVTDKQIEEIQNKNAAEVEKFERHILGLDAKKDLAKNSPDEDSKDLENENRLADSEAEEDSAVVSLDDESLSTEDTLAAAVDADEAEEEADDDELVDDDSLEEADEDEELEESKHMGTLEDTDVLRDFGEAETEEVEEEQEPEAEEIEGEEIDADAEEEQATDSEQSDVADPASTELDEAGKSLQEYYGALSQNFKEAATTEATKKKAKAASKKDAKKEEVTYPPLIAMTLTIRNKVNGKLVPRPENLSKDDKWAVEYMLGEVESPKNAWTLYEATKKRRALQFEVRPTVDKHGAPTRASITSADFLEQLRAMSQYGREFREKEDVRDMKEGFHVYGEEEKRFKGLPQKRVEEKEQGEDV